MDDVRCSPVTSNGDGVTPSQGMRLRTSDPPESRLLALTLEAITADCETILTLTCTSNTTQPGYHGCGSIIGNRKKFPKRKEKKRKRRDFLTYWYTFYL